MKFLAFVLLIALVFGGVAAYELERRGLLTRETLDLYLAKGEEKEAGTLIATEPVGLAAAISASKQELREQSQDIKLLNERLKAQREELGEQTALLEDRIEDLRAEEKKLDAWRTGGLGPGAMSGKQARLVKMYGSMAPDDAAALLDDMSDETVARMLLRMRDRQAAQIMGALDKDKASKVARLLWAEDGPRDLSATEPAEPVSAP